MLTSPVYPRTSLLFKSCECLLAMIGMLSVLLVLVEMALLPLLNDAVQTLNRYEDYGVVGSLIVALLATIVYVWVWHRREQAGTLGLAQSALRHAWLQGMIRYWLAFSICLYGFAKLFNVQFQTPTYRLDMPLGEVSGMGLTWHYYGYSYTLAAIIGLFQIGGSILLLYRRTTLLGVMVLLPVMVNIVLINVIFGIGNGAFVNSVVFTLALVFLLLLDVDKLKRAFWDLMERVPPVSLGGNWVKHGLRLLAVLGAAGLVQYTIATVPSETALTGTWKVDQLTRNGQVVAAQAWLTDTTAWNRVYFSGVQGVVFSPNPYRYRPKESWRGNYAFDSTKNTLRLLMYASDAAKIPDTLLATLTKRTANALRLQATWPQDTLDMQLARLR